HAPVGRTDSRYPLLGAADGRRKLSNLCGELHAPWVSRALVSGVAPIYVSVSRGRLLRRRLTRIRAAAAGTLSIQIQDRKRATMDTRRPATDIEPAGLKRSYWPYRSNRSYRLALEGDRYD